MIFIKIIHISIVKITHINHIISVFQDKLLLQPRYLDSVT